MQYKITRATDCADSVVKKYDSEFYQIASVLYEAKKQIFITARKIFTALSLVTYHLAVLI